jgi:hypothetical protein
MVLGTGRESGGSLVGLSLQPTGSATGQVLSELN